MRIFLNGGNFPSEKGNNQERHRPSFSFTAFKVFQVILKLTANLETNYIQTNKTDILKEWWYFVMNSWNTNTNYKKNYIPL